MKPDIHPKYYPEAKIKCACGATFTVGSAKPELHTEICSRCHPFWSGEKRYVDTAKRVERFEVRRQKAASVLKSPAKKRIERNRKNPKSNRKLKTRN